MKCCDVASEKPALAIYVAGPYTQGDPQKNTDHAIDVADQLRVAGERLGVNVVPIVPHLFHYWEARHAHGYETWMEMDFELLRRSDALFRLEGYSPGAEREVLVARKTGLPVFRDVEQFRRYLYLQTEFVGGSA